MRRLKSLEEVDEIIKTYFSKKTLTNNYLLFEDYKMHLGARRAFVLLGSYNAALLIQKLDFYRLYYFINEIGEKLTENINHNMVMEILFRGPKRYPEQEVSYWIKQGFIKHLQRDCYLLKGKDVSNNPTSENSARVVISKAATAQDLKYVKGAMELDLDHYTGDMLTFEQIENYCASGDIFIISVGGKYAGFLQAALKNKVYWLEHIVVSSIYRGMGLSKALMNAYLEEGLNKECRSFQLWVINDNIAALNLYHKYGFQYLNKSTISLLKEANG